MTAEGETPSTLYSTNTYGYNDADWGDLLTSFNGHTITYDAIGNPLNYYNGSSFSFTWKNGRQLATAAKGTYVLSYDYNDEGIRTSKTVNGVEHTYSLSGSQIVAEEWGSNLCVYLYDADGAPIGMQYRTTSMAKGDFYTFWFEKNLQGDIVAVYNESGTKVYTYQYDAWGNCTVSTESGTTTIQKRIVRTLNPFRYRGYYYDTDTGLYYLQSRYYNPQWGRFLNADGYVSTGTGLLGYNMYAYCNNNPVMYCDCTGTCQHNGVAYGMGADCPSCMAGITKPEYDKIPVAQPSQTEDTNYEQYYIEKANESVLEPENSFSLAQDIINIPLNIFVTSLGLIPNTTWGVTAVGYVITTPIAITMHLARAC